MEFAKGGTVGQMGDLDETVLTRSQPATSAELRSNLSLKDLGAKPASLLSREKELPQVTQRDSLPFTTTYSFTLVWGVASIRYRIRVRSSLLHNAQRRAPHN